MKPHEKLVAHLKPHLQTIIDGTNRAITSAGWLEVFGCPLGEMVQDSNQQTQDTTKLLQYVVNQRICELIDEGKIEGRKENANGYDYVILSEELEFKVLGVTYDEEGKMTGKQSFATGGASGDTQKAPLVWTIKYVFIDGQIAEVASIIVDTSMAVDGKESCWYKNGKDNNNYSTLKIDYRRNQALAANGVGVLRGNLIKPKGGNAKFLQIIPE